MTTTQQVDSLPLIPKGVVVMSQTLEAAVQQHVLVAPGLVSTTQEINRVKRRLVQLEEFDVISHMSQISKPSKANYTEEIKHLLHTFVIKKSNFRLKHPNRIL